MSGHTKLVHDILTSSIWQLDHATRIVWITILALKDMDGFIAASLPGLAHTARVTREECEKAMTLFESPDPDSRTPDNAGRRVERVDGGWVVLNHYLYRDRLSNDPETVKARLRMQKYRQRHPTVTKRNVTVGGVTLRNEPVTSCNAVSVSVSGSALGGDKGGVGGWTLAECVAAAEAIGMPKAMVEAFFHHYNGQGWVKGNGQAIIRLGSALAQWKTNQVEHPSKVKPKAPNFREVIHA